MDTEISDRLDELPIFPLATVLFPGAIMPLHIFEERYKEMMRFAVENGAVFGMSYREDAAIGRETPPDKHSIGCVAKINAVMPLDEGKMNVVSTGLIRYRTVEVKQIVPFLLAHVEPFTDDPDIDGDLTRLFDDTLEASRKFLAAAQALDEAGATINSHELPEDPEALSLLMASVLPVDNVAKQQLLEMTSTRLRLTRVRHHLIGALPHYSERLEMRERAKHNGRGRLQ